MADLILNGKEITFDLSKVTHKEFVRFWNGRPKDMTPEQEAERDAFDEDFIFRITGLTSAQIEELSQIDWRRFNDKFVKVSFASVDDYEKNSVSGSTSQA